MAQKSNYHHKSRRIVSLQQIHPIGVYKLNDSCQDSSITSAGYVLNGCAIMGK